MGAVWWHFMRTLRNNFSGFCKGEHNLFKIGGVNMKNHKESIQ